MPSPTSVHAATIINLIALLLPLVARIRGRLFTAPLDVFIPGGDPVQPDILVVLPASKARVELRGVEGPPDLVIEVVSPSNRGRDLLTKRALYARAGVREYWLVDPEARTIEILALDRDAFHLAVAASGDETPVSPLLGQFPITANDSSLISTLIPPAIVSRYACPLPTSKTEPCAKREGWLDQERR